MTVLRNRLTRSQVDAGVSLVEVLVAMFIFALVSSGLVFTMLSVLSLTRDSRAREVAANLAAEEIDLARDAGDLFALLDETRTVSLNGDTFTVTRRTQWVSDPGAEFSCGSGSGVLRYKRVNVDVTWSNMRSGAAAVHSDTVLNPAAHINDPTKGTILVEVLGADGTGATGVTIATSPSTGTLITPTDAQGCTYILKVAPGTYTVTASKTGFVNDSHAGTASTSVEVVQGTSASVGFQLDRAATYNARLAAPAPLGTVRVPSSLKTTFTNTYGAKAVAPSQGASTLAQKFTLHPFAAGFEAYVGDCDAADPAQWPEAPDPGGTLKGVRATTDAAPPGGTAAIDIPMGLIQVKGVANGGRYLKATPATPVAGAPGCSSGASYTFGEIVPTNVNSTVTIGLPYGSWTLTRGNSSSQDTTIGSTGVVVPGPAVPTRTTVAGDGTVTFDPRTVVAP